MTGSALVDPLLNEPISPAHHARARRRQVRDDVTQNYPLQLSGATFKEAIAVRVLQVQHQSALSRAFKKIACS